MLNEITIIRPKLTKYQKDILYCPERFTVTEASTKVGKTFSHLWWIFEVAHNPPKVGANYWWVAPVYSQAKIAFTRMRRTIAGKEGYRINESELFIVTPKKSTIWFKSAEKPDNLYGEDVFGIVFDEFTRAREESWTALRSTLTHTKGKCKFIGNVRGKHNWGYRLGVKAKGGEPGYKHFKLTAYDAVEAGILDIEEVNQAQRDLPDKAFRQLYLGEAFDEEANPFGIEFIRKAIVPQLSNQPSVCYGIDLAKSVDWTVVIGLDQSGKPSEFHRWQSDWGQTKRRIIDLVKFKPAFIDSTGVGDPIAEEVIRSCPKVERYHFTNTSKQQIMEGLALSLQKSEVYITKEMQDELESFEFVYSRSGVKYSAPDGMHDDIVCALALANAKRNKPTLKLRAI